MILPNHSSRLHRKLCTQKHKQLCLFQHAAALLNVTQGHNIQLLIVNNYIHVNTLWPFVRSKSKIPVDIIIKFICKKHFFGVVLIKFDVSEIPVRILYSYPSPIPELSLIRVTREHLASSLRAKPVCCVRGRGFKDWGV